MTRLSSPISTRPKRRVESTAAQTTPNSASLAMNAAAKSFKSTSTRVSPFITKTGVLLSTLRACAKAPAVPRGSLSTTGTICMSGRSMLAR
jgi:hypothetical protein